MSNPEQIADAEQIKHFQETIHGKWGCPVVFKGKVTCDINPVPRSGAVFVFSFPAPSDKCHWAEQCLAWNGRWFHNSGKVGDDQKEDAIVLDMEVLAESKELPLSALWAWFTKTLINLDKDPDVYVQGGKWTGDALHFEPVEFSLAGEDYERTQFFVRERNGLMAVRVFQSGNMKLDGVTERVRKSVRSLSAMEIDRIEKTDSGGFRLEL